MPGFLISNSSGDYKLSNFRQRQYIEESIPNSKYTIQRSTMKKFMHDKLFREDEDYIFITEGVILNSRALCGDNGNDFFSTVKQMAKTCGDRYFDTFRGSFAGAHYDRALDRWVIYTDGLGQKPVFYYSKDGKWIASTDMRYVVDALREQNISYTLDREAAYQLLTYGFILSDRTLVQEIKKLTYGMCLEIENGQVDVKRYYDFQYECDRNNAQPLTECEIIDQMDALFRKAVTMSYEKDNEYEYRHFATMSGGLDSRMTNWVAYALGYRAGLNLTFGESECIDEKIAKKVSNCLGNELLYKSLNNGEMLKNYDEVIKMNLGISLYPAAAHILSALKLVNGEQYGILHTGDLGDVVIGSYVLGDEGTCPGAYSIKLAHRLTENWNGIGNMEKYKMVTRGFNGVVTSNIVGDNYFYSISPFLYREFFEFCVGVIPKSMRDGHYIYKKWILQKYPEAAKIPVERYNNGLITDGPAMQTWHKIKQKGLAGILRWTMRKIGIPVSDRQKGAWTGMNPVDKWYAEKPEIRTKLDSFYNKTLGEFSRWEKTDVQLADDMHLLYQEGTTMEKAQVITVLASVKELFLS